MAIAKNKKVFSVTVDDVTTEYAVRMPTLGEKNEAQAEFNKAFQRHVQSGAIVRAQVDKIVRVRNLWDDELEEKYKSMYDEIRKIELTLRKGGILKSKMRELCIKLRELRYDASTLRSPVTSLDNMTAEAQAETDKFNYLVAKCTVYNTGGEAGKQVFQDVEDFLNRTSDKVAVEAARNLMELVYGLDLDSDKKLIENKLLVEHGLADEKLRLINKDGHLIDVDFNLINEDGRYVNSDGEFVNIDGDRVDEEGNVIVESQPFIDDESESEPEKESETKARRGRPVKA